MTFEDWKINQLALGNLWYSSVSSGRTKKGDLVGIWKTKFRAKEKNAKKEGIKVNLSFDEFLVKAWEAKLVCPSQIGVKSDKYQLSRKNDSGNYTVESCRFLTRIENEKEKSQDYNLFASKASSNASTLEAWLNADKVFYLWKVENLGRFRISKKLGYGGNKSFISACDSMIARRFKEGWVPMNDKKWLRWKSRNV